MWTDAIAVPLVVSDPRLTSLSGKFFPYANQTRTEVKVCTYIYPTWTVYAANRPKKFLICIGLRVFAPAVG